MIIQTEGLTKRFGRKKAVTGLDLAVAEGSALALIGANGAGKTTTLRMLVNLLRPDAGSARVLGVDSRRLSWRERTRVGYVSENQLPPPLLSVEQYFEYLRPLYSTWDRSLEADLRRRLDLPAKAPLNSLSHGMRLKTALAAALPFHPELLVLDEPLGGLDPLVRDEVMEGLLLQAGEMTIVISSHELVEIEGFATDVAFLEDGRLLFQEPMEALSARFRDVRITLQTEDAGPTGLPATWIGSDRAGRTLRFIDSGFAGDAALAAEAQRRLGPIAAIDAQPMSLREISKTLMRVHATEARP
jgi:ABC-2 type transport system ATP-binding protein